MICHCTCSYCDTGYHCRSTIRGCFHGADVLPSTRSFFIGLIALFAAEQAASGIVGPSYFGPIGPGAFSASSGSSARGMDLAPGGIGCTECEEVFDTSGTYRGIHCDSCERFQSKMPMEGERCP